MSGNVPVRATWMVWWMVLVLAILTVVSFVDRNALSVLIDDVRGEFGLTDSEAGLLLGASFALLYAAAGLPAGYIVDRYSRRVTICFAVIFWSLMTALSGVATSFGWLFVLRMGVGLGEAVLSPAGSSLIRNAVPLAQRPKAFGLVTIASSAGAGLALLIVGLLTGVIPDAGIHVPLLGDLSAWRAVFVVIGLLGVPMALLALSFPEPKRETGGAEGEVATMGFYFGWLRRRADFYVPVYAAMATVGIGTYGFSAWMPAAMARKWGLQASEVGITYGSIQVAASISGVILGTFLMSRLMTRFGAAASLWVSAACAVIAGISAVLMPLMPSTQLAWAMLALHWLVVPTSGAGCFTALTAATPNATMGKVMATGYIFLSVTGYGLGPSLIAAVSDHLLSGRNSIGLAISIVAGLALAISSACYFRASRRLIVHETTASSSSRS